MPECHPWVSATHLCFIFTCNHPLNVKYTNAVGATRGSTEPRVRTGTAPAERAQPPRRPSRSGSPRSATQGVTQEPCGAPSAPRSARNHRYCFPFPCGRAARGRFSPLRLRRVRGPPRAARPGTLWGRSSQAALLPFPFLPGPSRTFFLLRRCRVPGGADFSSAAVPL